MSRRRPRHRPTRPGTAPPEPSSGARDPPGGDLGEHPVCGSGRAAYPSPPSVADRRGRRRWKFCCRKWLREVVPGAPAGAAVTVRAHRGRVGSIHRCVANTLLRLLPGILGCTRLWNPQVIHQSIHSFGTLGRAGCPQPVYPQFPQAISSTPTELRTSGQRPGDSLWIPRGFLEESTGYPPIRTQCAQLPGFWGPTWG